MKFRGKETNGWKVIIAYSREKLEKELNGLMEQYEFVDCQYSITKTTWTALVLLGDKNED